MIDKIYSRIEQLAKNIKDDLRKKGFVVPCDNGDGTVSVDSYQIIKEKSGFYSIKDYSNETVIEKINLPQTAAILANGLALGKWLDNEIVSIDRHYGYSLFQETLTKQGAQKSLLRKDVDRADLLFTKSSIARTKKLIARQQIYDRFEKLRRLR
jgi:hypothetical protein